MKRFLCFALFLSLRLYAASAPNDGYAAYQSDLAAYKPNDLKCITYTNQHFLSLWRNQGRSIYSNRSYTSLEFFSFPVRINHTHPFFDLRYHHFDKGENAFSAGFGVRFDSPCSCRIFGVNVFYDFRRACHSAYNQFGLGLEYLGKCWNFRLNGYLPLGNKSHRCSFCLFDDFIGDFFFIHETFRDSLKGVNFEIERVIRSCNKEVSFAIAPYYYHQRKGCHRDIYGSQARLTATVCNCFRNCCHRLVFSVLGSYDNAFKGRVQAQIGIIFPLYFTKNEQQQQSFDCSNPLLFQRIQRNDAIILKKRNRWIWNF